MLLIEANAIDYRFIKHSRGVDHKNAILIIYFSAFDNLEPLLLYIEWSHLHKHSPIRRTPGNFPGSACRISYPAASWRNIELKSGARGIAIKTMENRMFSLSSRDGFMRVLNRNTPGEYNAEYRLYINRSKLRGIKPKETKQRTEFYDSIHLLSDNCPGIPVFFEPVGFRL